MTHTIVYTYDNLYRLTHANYSTSEAYAYSYDPVGNRLQQIINGNTTSYQYDAANRLAQVNGQNNVFDANGNLKQMGVMSNTFDAANRLVSTQRIPVRQRRAAGLDHRPGLPPHQAGVRLRGAPGADHL